jgi:lipoate-protein ligase A
MGQSTFKVPGGKMLKIQLSVSDGKISQVTIMGDFFLHPEETVLAIEEKLKGLKPEREALTVVIQKVLDENSALLIGAEAKDIAEAIFLAL